MCIIDFAEVDWSKSIKVKVVMDLVKNMKDYYVLCVSSISQILLGQKHTIL